MPDAKRDSNYVPTLIAVSNVDGITPVVLWADPTTHRLLVDAAGVGANTALSNLAAVAINVALLPGTSDSIALGSATRMWSDLFLGDGAVINFNNGDVTLTHSLNVLALGGGSLQITNLTASEILATDASKNLVSLAVATYPSLTELTYVKGVTSALQTQIDAKMTNPMTTGGDIIYGGVSGVGTRLANGSAGQVLQSNGTTLAPTWVAVGLGTVTGTGTVNEIAYWTGASALGTLAVATYPSLTELSYVKGVTSALQTQINAKQGTLTNSAGLLAALSDETGTGLAVFSTAPVFTTSIQTPTVELGHATDTTISRSSAGVIAVEGVVIPSISSTNTLTNKTLTSPTLTTPVLGTPSSGTLTSCTGLPLTGLVSDTTTALGIGSINLGHASDTTISRVSAGVIAIEGVTLVSNATHSGDATGATVLTIAANAVTNAKAAQMATKTYKGRTTAGTGNSEDVAVATLKTDLVLVRADVGLGNVDNTSNATERAATATLTNKRITPRILSAASYTTNTGTSIAGDTQDMFIVTAQTGALLFNAPSGTPTDGQKLIITVASSTTVARALTWNAIYGATTVALPTTTAATTVTLSIGFIYSSSKVLWQCVAVS